MMIMVLMVASMYNYYLTHNVWYEHIIINTHTANDQSIRARNII